MRREADDAEYLLYLLLRHMQHAGKQRITPRITPGAAVPQCDIVPLSEKTDEEKRRREEKKGVKESSCLASLPGYQKCCLLK